MFLLTVYLSLILLDFKFPKSKFIMVLNFIFMWILMGWNHSVADYSVYSNRYYYPDVYKTLEPLYKLFQYFGQQKYMTYDDFLIIMSFIFLALRVISIIILSEKPNAVIGLYLLFPFIMDITQIRMFYATSVVLLGLALMTRLKKNGELFFILSVIVASMIHSACIFYILIVLIKKIGFKDIKKYNCIILLIIFILYFLLGTGLLYFISSKITSLLGFGRKFVETTYATSKVYSLMDKIIYMVEILLFFMINKLLINKLLKYLNKSSSYSILNEGTMENLLICHKINYCLLIILPFAWFSGDIYRVQHGILIYFYSIYLNNGFFTSEKKGYITIYQIILSLFILILVILFLLGIESLRTNVFIPVFFENNFIR